MEAKKEKDACRALALSRRRAQSAGERHAHSLALCRLLENLPELREFGTLTVTEGEMELRFAGGFIHMKAGDTCFLPKDSPRMALIGSGTAALAMPNQ